MAELERLLNQAQETAQASSQKAEILVFLAWLLPIVLAMAVAAWMFRDAESRGKSGVGAALVAFFSVSYGIAAIFIVLGLWLLLRPELTCSSGKKSQSDLPVELPSGIHSGPTSEEFLQNLSGND